MQFTPYSEAVSALQQCACLTTGAANDYDPLMELIADARFVLLGAASYGTHEFCACRARITRRLIEEKDFNAVAVDANWCDASLVNRYVHGVGGDGDALAELNDFQPFPTWMWRSAPMLDFIDWLRCHNSTGDRARPKTGFYGLDLFDSYGSIEAVVRYVDQFDPLTARWMRRRYAHFDQFGENDTADSDACHVYWDQGLKDRVVDHLLELRPAAQSIEWGGRHDRIDGFSVAQNAFLATNAERYYRKMFGERAAWWNLRSRHMVDMLEDLAEHLGQSAGQSKVVVWAHNLHVGDARATETGRQGGLSVGQILRARYGRDVVLVGFTTYAGTVTAASEWDSPAEFKHLDPALPGSYESLFHDTGHPRFVLPLRNSEVAVGFLREEHLERSIGVVYVPKAERFAPYLHARLPEQFDVLVHFDQTAALQPVDRAFGGGTGEVPESILAGV